MKFVARLPSDLDQAMTLFRLRALGATCEFVTAPGASDMQLTGDVPDDRIDDLAAFLQERPGALHAGDRHIALDGGATDHDSIRAAEAHLGGPFTVPGALRSTWSFGSDERDHVVQCLYETDEHLGIKAIHEATGLQVQQVMTVIKHLTEDGTVRRFRQTDQGPVGDAFGLAREIRDRIDAAIVSD